MKVFGKPREFGKVGQYDDRLKNNVQAALARSVRPEIHRINVGVHEGHVTIRGAVNSYYRKQLAQVAVMSVDGVASVNNTLEVVSDESALTPLPL